MEITTQAVENATGILQEWYNIAEQLVLQNNINARNNNLDVISAEIVHRLSNTKHATRGAALTLCLSKKMHPDLDIRNHKVEIGEGFSARRIDTKVTVPFLNSQGLPYSVESHWMTRTLANDSPYMPGLVLKTTPKSAGPDLVSVANMIQNAATQEELDTIGIILFIGLITERNLGKIPLTKPKNLSIDQVMTLLHLHFAQHYTKNTPRLPQVALYAIYKCLKNSVERYHDFELMPLERMKTANRKSGTVGDIDLCYNGRPIEAVEVKYDIAPSAGIVAEAMQKVLSESVERYFILSTKPPVPEDLEQIEQMKESFRHSNGCEIIVNGVFDTIKYYLRLLKSTNEFINNYTDLLGNDEDLNYEHKSAWNTICAQLK